MADPETPALEGEEVAMGGGLSGAFTDVISRVAPIIEREMAERAGESLGAETGRQAGEAAGAAGVVEGASPEIDAGALVEGARAILDAQSEDRPAGQLFERLGDVLHDVQERLEAITADQAVLEAEAPLEAAPAAEAAPAVVEDADGADDAAPYDPAEA